MEVDVSSYKQPTQPSMLDVAGKVGTLHQQKLSIDKSKLDQINQGYGYLMRELSSLSDSATADDARRVIEGAVKLKLFTPEIAASAISSIPSDPTKVRQWLDEARTKMLDTQAAINYNVGSQGFINNNQQTTPVRTPMRGGPIPTSAPIQLQEPPSTETMGPDNQPQRLGPQAPRVPTGRLPVAGGIPGQFVDPNSPLPVREVPTTREPRIPTTGAPALSPLGQTAQGSVNNRFPQPVGSAAGLPVGEAAAIGGEATQLTSDRNLATERMLQALPMKKALQLIPQTMTGVGAPTLNAVRAGLIQAGIIQADENDPTIIYQELNKALKNYITRSGSADRSDARQALAEASTANAEKQLNPALIRIARDAIGYDRIEAARAISYNGPVAGYGRYRTTFANNIDPKAFTIDLLPTEDRIKLLDKMKADIASGNAQAKRNAEKFWDSLKVARDTLKLDVLQ